MSSKDERRAVAEKTDHGYAAGIEGESGTAMWHADTAARALARAANDRAQQAANLAAAAARDAEDARLLLAACLQEVGDPLKSSDHPPVPVADLFRATKIQQVEAERNSLHNILSDLDRCEHGRHEGDDCTLSGGCGGPSKGNPLLGPDRTIGYSLDGVPIRVPERGESWGRRSN